jgi:type III restriction enzyme
MLDAEVHHTISLDGTGVADYRSVVGFFARQLLKDLRLVGGYEVLYPKVRDFMRDHLFIPAPVNLEDPVVLRNLSEPDAGKILYNAFKSAINALTVQETGTTRIEDRIRLKETRPFRTDYRSHLTATKSIFNKVVGEPHSGGFELRFGYFLEAATDVQAFAKNYLAVGFKLDYVRTNGDLANYYPDFFVRTTDGIVWLVETKGRAELDLPQKMARLRQWCTDATAAEAAEGGAPGRRYDFVYVDQPGFEEHRPKTFAALAASFTEYKS